MTNAEQWQRSGFEALERGDVDAALAAAEELRALRNTAAFEIGALAHLRAGRADEALQMLEEGVEHGPDVWLLWQLLGNVQSDLGRAKDARAAYDRAAGCTEADLASIDLNRSILATRDGRGEDALAALARHDDAALRSRGDDIWVRYAWSEACALLALHRPDEARDRLERALEHEHEPEQPADLLASLAEAHLDLEDPAAATAAARRALAYERGHAHALWCIREAEGVTVQAARSFRIVVEGALPEAPEDAPGMTGFYTTYEAVGENLEDALARARGLEPDGVQASIRVSESEEFALDEPVPSGVYGMYPYHLFDPNGDDAE